MRPSSCGGDEVVESWESVVEVVVGSADCPQPTQEATSTSIAHVRSSISLTVSVWTTRETLPVPSAWTDLELENSEVSEAAGVKERLGFSPLGSQTETLELVP